MKLIKINKIKENKTRNVLIAFGVIIAIMACVIISKSYAIYKLEKKYDIIQTKVGTFPKGDVQISVLVDGQESSTFPTYQDNYYVESVDCTNGVTGTFDVESWEIKIADMSATSTKCTVSFDSHKTNSVTPINMSKAQLVALNETITNTAAAVLLDKVYPVGSIYMTTTEDTVAKVQAKFGGTWEKYSDGKTLVGDDGTNYITGDSTKGSGGSSTVTLAANQIPTHSCSGTTGSGGAHTHTVTTTAANGVGSTTSDGAHAHGIRVSSTTITISGSTWINYLIQNEYTDINTKSAGAHTHKLNIPALSGTAASNGAHTHTFTGTYTNNSQASVNVQNPYTVVYMYKRVS